MDTPPKPLLDDYLDDPALAAEFDVSIRTIWRWRAERTGPATTYVGKKPYTHIDDAARWLKDHRREPVRAGAR